MQGLWTVPAHTLHRLPDVLSLRDASLVEPIAVACHDVRLGEVRAGEFVVVIGGGPIGALVALVARHKGARVIVTCSTSKIPACRHLGADLIVDYTQTDFVDAVKTFTKGRGVDVVLDVVGGDYVDRNIACLATKGSIVQVGTMAGPPPAVNVGALMFKRARIIGTVLRARPLDEKIAISRRFAEEMLPLFDSGALKPVIDSRYTLDDVAEAHEHMGANANAGKIVIDVS